MTLLERGLYMTLLNIAWLNDGLPTTTTELHKLVKCPRDQFARAWPKVSRCFDLLDDGKLRNKRQEKERARAAERSSKATDAVRTRYERSTNDLPRAYDYDYVSSVVVTAEGKQTVDACSISDSDTWADSVYSRWKKYRDRILALQALCQLTCTREQFEATYTKWVEYHERVGWQYAPTLASFLHDRTFEHEPPQLGEPLRRKSVAEEAQERAVEQMKKRGDWE